jgi:amino acid permease
VELIGIAAGETERPRETLPKVVRHVSVRLVFYYVGVVLALSLTVSSNDPILRLIVTNESYGYYNPFTLMAQRAGIPVLAHLFTGVAVIACISVANASLYVTVRGSQAPANTRAELCMPLRGRGKPLQYLQGRHCLTSLSGVSEFQL